MAQSVAKRFIFVLFIYLIKEAMLTPNITVWITFKINLTL